MFTQEQINQLLKNKNVHKCSFKSITFRGKFKLKAVENYFNKGLSPNMIFEEAGFDLNVIGRELPKSSLSRWRRIYNKRGKKELLKENRGGPGRRKKVEFKNDKEEIEYLKTKITYMDAENDFLANLQGLKRE